MFRSLCPSPSLDAHHIIKQPNTCSPKNYDNLSFSTIIIWPTAYWATTMATKTSTATHLVFLGHIDLRSAWADKRIACLDQQSTKPARASAASGQLDANTNTKVDWQLILPSVGLVLSFVLSPHPNPNQQMTKIVETTFRNSMSSKMFFGGWQFHFEVEHRYESRDPNYFAEISVLSKVGHSACCVACMCVMLCWYINCIINDICCDSHTHSSTEFLRIVSSLIHEMAKS